MFIRTESSVKEFIQSYPIVTVLVIIHFALWLIINFLKLPFGMQLFQWGAGHNFSIYEYGEYWRFVTPIFLHGDFMHALFNSFSLVLFGPALEQMLGRFKFILAYLLAGIAGNIGTYFMDPTSFTVHIGASGSIFGLFGIYVFMVFFRKHLIDSVNSQIVLTIFIIGLVMTFIRPNINIYAHIFGFIGGFALGPIILNNARQFSIYRNYRPRSNMDEIQFNPNRWKRRRLSRQMKTNILWIIFGILVVIGLLNRFF